MTEQLFKQVTNEDGSVCYKPVQEKQAQPSRHQISKGGDVYRTISSGGKSCYYRLAYGPEGSPWERYAFFNLYPQQDDLTQVVENMRRTNAIIMACHMVEPNYTPDFQSEAYKFCVYYDIDDEVWRVRASRRMKYGASYVSTEEKAQQVCELLIQWDVK